VGRLEHGPQRRRPPTTIHRGDNDVHYTGGNERVNREPFATAAIVTLPVPLSLQPHVNLQNLSQIDLKSLVRFPHNSQ